ncbi:hypothetical protein TRVL_09798 [Trypanosoma vivax]|nr:hypothetical protein TRVL_09798 [Trypanosoma vivax]
MSDSAARVFGQSFFSFAHVSRADEGITSTDGFARMESGELRASLDKKQVNFIDLPSTAVSPELPESDDFIRALEATWDCLVGKWQGLEERIRTLPAVRNSTGTNSRRTPTNACANRCNECRK